MSCSFNRNTSQKTPKVLSFKTDNDFNCPGHTVFKMEKKISSFKQVTAINLGFNTITIPII